MIYDCFIFFNELELLTIRLNTLDPVVDKFVLVEGTRTHHYLPKPLYFEQNKDLYKKFQDKIIHVIVDDYPTDISRWTLETYQRNCIIRGLTSCKEDDMIMFSDVDEIPNPDFVKKYAALLTSGKIISFEGTYFTMYFNLFNPYLVRTRGAKLLFFKDCQNILDNDKRTIHGLDAKINKGTTFSKIRIYNGSKQKVVINSGWHFSSIGGASRVEQKIQAVSEGSVNFDIVGANNLIKHRVKKGFAVFLDDSFPKYLIENKDKYAHLMITPTHKFSDAIRWSYFYRCIWRIRRTFTRLVCLFIPSKEYRIRVRNILGP